MLWQTSTFPVWESQGYDEESRIHKCQFPTIVCTTHTHEWISQIRLLSDWVSNDFINSPLWISPWIYGVAPAALFCILRSLSNGPVKTTILLQWSQPQVSLQWCLLQEYSLRSAAAQTGDLAYSNNTISNAKYTLSVVSHRNFNCRCSCLTGSVQKSKGALDLSCSWSCFILTLLLGTNA